MTTQTFRPFTVHVAAPPIGPTQACAACGTTLMDNTAWHEGRAAIPDGTEYDGPSWWPTGQRVATNKRDGSGGITYAVGPDDRPLADDEQPCGGHN